MIIICAIVLAGLAAAVYFGIKSRDERVYDANGHRIPLNCNVSYNGVSYVAIALLKNNMVRIGHADRFDPAFIEVDGKLVTNLP